MIEAMIQYSSIQTENRRNKPLVWHHDRLRRFITARMVGSSSLMHWRSYK